MTQVPKLASWKIGHQVLSVGQNIKEKNQSQTKIIGIKPKPDKTWKNSNWVGSRELGSVVASRSAKEEFKHEAKTIYTSFTFH